MQSCQNLLRKGGRKKESCRLFRLMVQERGDIFSSEGLKNESRIETEERKQREQPQIEVVTHILVEKKAAFAAFVGIDAVQFGSGSIKMKQLHIFFFFFTKITLVLRRPKNCEIMVLDIPSKRFEVARKADTSIGEGNVVACKWYSWMRQCVARLDNTRFKEDGIFGRGMRDRLEAALGTKKKIHLQAMSYTHVVWEETTALLGSIQ